MDEPLLIVSEIVKAQEGNNMTDPCLKCKKKQNFPNVCYPRRDYMKAVKRRKHDRKRTGPNQRGKQSDPVR